MKIAVVGGAGKVVLGAIRDFVEDQSVEKLLLADINIDFLEQRKKELNAQKVVISELDLNDHHSLVNLLGEYDACLNGSSHIFNLNVMKACLESKTHYTDFGGLFHWARKQLEFGEEFKKAGITGIVGSGSAPGIVNVMSRYAYDHLDTVESVDIRDGIVNFNIDEYSFVPPYAIETLLDEYIMNPYEFNNGEFQEMSPFSGEEIINFPEPIGEQKVINTIHSEVATIPLSFKDKGIQRVTFKLSLPRVFEDRLKFLVKLGVGSSDPIKVGGQEVVPRKLLAELIKNNAFNESEKTQEVKHDDHKALRVEVEGTKDGENVKYIVDCILSPYEKWPDLSQGVFSVGYPAAVTTKLLARGDIKQEGFFASEAVIPPKIYFAELSKRGIHVHANLIKKI